MFNAISKSQFILFPLFVLGLLASCNSDKEYTNAEELLGQADRLLTEKQYQSAIDSIKVLNERYPNFPDIHRSALRIQANALEGLVMDSIMIVDPILNSSIIEVDSLKGFFSYCQPAAEGMDGYFTPISLQKSTLMTSTGIEPRVNEQGYFFIVCNIEKSKIDLYQIKISTDGSEWFSSPISTNRIINVENSEIASLAPEDISGLGTWLASHPSKNYNGTFIGHKNSISFKITEPLAESIILCENYSKAILTQRNSAIQREKLERKLQAIRQTIANLPLPSQD